MCFGGSFQFSVPHQFRNGDGHRAHFCIQLYFREKATGVLPLKMSVKPETFHQFRIPFHNRNITFQGVPVTRCHFIELTSMSVGVAVIGYEFTQLHQLSAVLRISLADVPENTCRFFCVCALSYLVWFTSDNISIALVYKNQIRYSPTN